MYGSAHCRAAAGAVRTSLKLQLARLCVDEAQTQHEAVTAAAAVSKSSRAVLKRLMTGCSSALQYVCAAVVVARKTGVQGSS
jgi:hypothetical protein